MVVKAYRAFVTKMLWIGNISASKSILLKLIANSSRAITKLTAADIERDQDKMNFKIAEKVSSDNIIESLKNDDEQAVKAFLNFIRHIMSAYIEPNLNPRRRLYSAWHAVFFCRLWKESLTKAKSRNTPKTPKQKDIFTPTIQDGFISHNLHVCVEINAHMLLKFLVYCRDLGKPELFLPNFTGSQDNEEFFRTARSMTSTFHTVINFDIKELLERAKRIEAIAEITRKVDDFEFARKQKLKPSFVPTKLLSDEEIEIVVKSACGTM